MSKTIDEIELVMMEKALHDCVRRLMLLKKCKRTGRFFKRVEYFRQDAAANLTNSHNEFYLEKHYGIRMKQHGILFIEVTDSASAERFLQNFKEIPVSLQYKRDN